MARRNKPHDPARATRERLDAIEERKRIEAQGGEVTLDRAGKIVSARRSNVFNLLLARHTITLDQFDAAYTLRQDWAAWKGLDGGPEPRMDFVCGSGELGEAERGAISAKYRLVAGAKVSRALTNVHPVTRLILEAFMVATVEEDRPMVWRGIMERLGWTSHDKQTQAFVGALEDLRIYYQEPGRVAA